MGIERKISKLQYAEVGFQIQRELLGNDPVTDYSILLSYDIDSRKWKKKKKSKDADPSPELN